MEPSHKERLKIRQAQKDRTKLNAQWDLFAADLMKRSGNDVEDGYRVKNNPLLIAAIEKIRDGYFDLLQKRASIYGRNSRPSQLSAEEERQVLAVDQKMIVYHWQAVKTLQENDFGFLPTEKSSILKKAKKKPGAEEVTQGLSETNSMRLLGAIILRCIRSAEVALPRYNHDIPKGDRLKDAFSKASKPMPRGI